MFSSKYRSKSFKELLGNSPTTDVIKEQLRRGTLPNFIILTGPPGSSKTTHSYLIAKRLLCSNPQDYEPCNECKECRSLNKSLYEAGRGASGLPVHKYTLDIDNDEEYMQTISQAVTVPATGRYGIKVVLLEELHVVSYNNQKKLQTPLENIPDNVYIIVSTSEPNNVIQPIKGRASIYKIPPAPKVAMMERLLEVAEIERHKLTKKDAEMIAKTSLSMREALNQLERFITAPDTAMKLYEAENTVDIERYRDYLNATKGGVTMVIEFVELLEDKMDFLNGMQSFFITYLKATRGVSIGLSREATNVIKREMGAYSNEVIMDILDITTRIGTPSETKAFTYLLLIGHKLNEGVFKGAKRPDKVAYQRVEKKQMLTSEEETRLNPVAMSTYNSPIEPFSAIEGEETGLDESLYNELETLGLVNFSTADIGENIKEKEISTEEYTDEPDEDPLGIIEESGGAMEDEYDFNYHFPEESGQLDFDED